MFEHRSLPLLSAPAFARRMLRFLLAGAAADSLVVLVGAAGFHANGQPWLDAWLDAALVVTGNGPTQQPDDPAGKLFLSVYALAGGTAYVIIAALVLAPALHRLLHLFHIRAPDD